MGMNFVALVRYHRTREVVRRINSLENQRQPISSEVQTLWKEQRFAPLNWDRAYWVSQKGSRQAKRPRAPSLDVALRTVDGFYLTFGQGACCFFHSLRWNIFLTQSAWQPVLLRACNTLADLLQAPDGAIMSDYHPSHTAFVRGAGYDACLQAAPSGEGEVAKIADLYRTVDAEGTWDSHGYWTFRRDGEAVSVTGLAAESFAEFDTGRSQ